MAARSATQGLQSEHLRREATEWLPGERLLLLGSYSVVAVLLDVFTELCVSKVFRNKFVCPVGAVVRVFHDSC